MARLLPRLLDRRLRPPGRTPQTQPPKRETLAMPHTLEMTRTYNAPPARVFACFTSKEEWSGWAGSRETPGEVTLLEPRVGGRYRMVMHRPDGVEMAVGGVFQVVEEPSRLAFTWKWEHGEDTTLITIF